MPIDAASPLTIWMDAEAPSLEEPGTGGHIRPGDVAWTASNVSETHDRRAILLMPLQLSPEWKITTTAGTPYARRRLSDFTPTGNVGEHEVNVAGDWWLSMPTGSIVQSTGAVWSAGVGNLSNNPYIYLEAFVFGPSATPAEVLRVEWGGFRLSLNGDGAARLWQDDGAGGWTLCTAGALVPRGDATHNHVRIRIYPICRRCLYIYGNGGELVWEDKTKDPAVDATALAASAPLVPAGPLTVSAFANMEVQVCEMGFAAAGQMDASRLLGYKPTEMVSFTTAEGRPLCWYDDDGAAAVTVSAPGFVADGTMDSLPIRIALASTADARRTPTFYAAGYRIPPKPRARAGNLTDITSLVLPGAELNVREDGSSLTFTAKKDVANWQTHTGRAVTLTIGEGEDQEEIWAGSVEGTEWDDESAIGAVTFLCEDPWAYLNSMLLPNTESLDGQILTDAAKSVMAYNGIPAERIDIQDSPFRLPSQEANFVQPAVGNAPAQGQFEAVVQPGTGTPSGEFVRYIFETFSSWKVFFGPSGGVYKFRAREESTLAGTPVRLYTTMAAAEAAGKDYRHVVRVSRPRIVPCEANEVHVYGQAPGGELLYAAYVDAASQDATLPDAERPTNWIGRPKQLFLIDASLNTQELVTHALYQLVERVTRAIETRFVESEWQPQLMQYGTMEIDAIDGAVLTFHVPEFRVRFETEAAPGGRRWRPADYTVWRYR